MKSHENDRERLCLARVIEFERISAYVIESFDNRMLKLFQIQNVDNFWLQPISYYIDDKLRVSLFYPQARSLHELLHSDERSELHFNAILQDEPLFTRIRIKYEIAF